MLRHRHVTRNVFEGQPVGDNTGIKPVYQSDQFPTGNNPPHSPAPRQLTLYDFLYVSISPVGEWHMFLTFPKNIYKIRNGESLIYGDKNAIVNRKSIGVDRMHEPSNAII